MVLLKFHHKPVICIPRDFLRPFVRQDLDDIITRDATDCVPGQELFVYNVKDTACVPVFLAEWVQSMDVTKSIELVMNTVTEEHFMSAAETGGPPGVPEIIRRFHNIFQHFSNDTTYTSDICDSMVDWYINYLRNNVNNLLNIFIACLRNDKKGDGGLIRVCANILMYHGKTLLTPENEEDFGYWLQDHIRQSDSHIPGDVIDPAFAHHCAYHQHGDDEFCYKQSKYTFPEDLQIRRLTRCTETQQTRALPLR